MRNNRVYVIDILDAVNAIESFVEGMDFNTFKEDDKTTSAVIRKFEIIGEASKNIPESVRKQYPQIPWKQMAGLRDKLIHFYFGVNYELLWSTIKTRLAAIRPALEQLANELHADQ